MTETMNDYLELRKVIQIILRWLWLLLLVALGGAGLGYVASKSQAPVYEATTTLMVGQVIQATQISRDDLLTNEVLAQTYTDMAVRQPVLQGVIDTLNLPDTWRGLKKRVHAELVEGTHLIQIRTEAESPEMARIIADEVARQLILLSANATQSRETAEARGFVNQRLDNLQKKIEYGRARLQSLESALLQAFEVGSDPNAIQRIQDLQGEINRLEELIDSWEAESTQIVIYLKDRSRANSLTIIEPAQASLNPIRPRTKLNALLAAAISFALAMGLVLFVEFRDDTLREPDEIQNALKTPVLGHIGKINGKSEHDRLLPALNPGSPLSEAYRIIRSNIEFKTAERPAKTIVITSPGRAEGKSLMAANLGITMAQAGLRTLIIDANLRQPMQHRLFRVANAAGLTEALRSPELALDHLVLETKIPNLFVLPSGQLPLNPTELLGAQRMREILASLGQMADIVICDSPPALGLADASILANRADGVVLVLGVGQTRLEDARQTISSLSLANARLLGVIVNRARSRFHRYLRVVNATSLATSATPRSSRRWQWLPF